MQAQCGRSGSDQDRLRQHRLSPQSRTTAQLRRSRRLMFSPASSCRWSCGPPFCPISPTAKAPRNPSRQRHPRRPESGRRPVHEGEGLQDLRLVRGLDRLRQVDEQVLHPVHQRKWQRNSRHLLVPPDQQDVSAELTKIKELKPRSSLFRRTDSAGRAARTQMDKFGINAQLEGNSGIMGDAFISALPGRNSPKAP